MNNKVIQALERQGLTNKSSESYGTLASATIRTRLDAYCTSTRCAGIAWAPVKKDLGGAKPDRCPDCRHALLYKRVRYGAGEE